MLMDALRAFALEQSRLLAEERAAVAKIAFAKGEADAENERLQAIIDAFMRHRFGPRSEQLDPDQLQLGLEDSETALAESKAADEAKSKLPIVRARPTVVRCPRISNGSNRSSMLKTRAVLAAVERCIRSAKMSPNASTSCPPPSGCWSRGARAMAAGHARAQWCRLRRQRGSSRAACPPRR